MLKGYLKCTETDKLILPYINFELSKKNMSRVAIHLRNCPNCMEKYSKIQRRKKELKGKMYEIEKTLRMENEISSYIDNEAGDEIIFIVEGMILCDSEYKKELLENEKLRQYMQSAKEFIKNETKTTISSEIIAKIRKKEIKKIKLIKRITRFFQPIRHVFAKC